MDAFHQRRRSYDAPATRANSMPIAMQSAAPVGESPFGRHAQPYSPLLRQSPYLLTRTPLSASLPGTYTIKEEGSYSLDTPAFVEHTRQTLQSMLRPQAAFAANSPPRRQSNTSFGGSSVRSYSDETAPTVAMLAHDREANMRTPRPHTALAVASNAMTAEPQSQYGDGTEGRIMQWQQRRDASDNTLDAREAPAAVRGAGQSMYASDSIGRMSTASSSYLGSEFGHGARALSASESVAGTSSLPRKNRKVAPPEVLVVVRPPPSKQGNPLNLQIQLVTPQAGGGSGGNTGARASADLSRDEIPASVTNASVSSATSSNATSSAALKTPPATGSALRRSNSVGSSRSALSEASTAFSTGSASTSGSGRRVTPLYNLCFHSFLPTTVTDAGTDQKVAKFGKRGVEIDGFGQLTPHELLSGINDLASADRRRRSFLVGPSSAGNGGGFGRPGSASGASDLASHGGRSDGSAGRSTEAMLIPTTSISDIASGGQARTTTSDDGAKAIQEPPTSFDAMSPQAKDPTRDLNSGGLGGKLLRSFKKFSVNAAANAPASSATASQKSMLSGRTGDTTETANANGGAGGLLARVRGAASKVKEGSEGMAAGHGGNGSAIDDEDGMSLADSARHGLHASETDIPQLAIGAGLRSDGTRRAQGYYWVVRRWNRRLGDNVEDDIDRLVPGRQTHGANPILNSVWKRFNVVNRMGGQEMHPPSSQIAVRFEWTRSESRKKSVTSSGVGRHGRAATDAGGGGRSVRSQSSVRGSLDARTPGHEAATMAAPATVAAMSTAEEAAKRSSEALRPPMNGGSGSGSRPSSLFGAARGSMDRTSAVSAGEDDEASDPEDSETKWACHLVLGPTTRIPIGSLAPTPHHPKLVAQLTVPYPLPDLSQSGLGIDGAGLTREELKDIISVTALFVIVREAFGGLAKRRKGDSALKFGAAAAQR